LDSRHGTSIATFRPTVMGIQNMNRQRGVRALVILAQIALLLVVLTRLVTASWALPIGVLLVAIFVGAIVGYLWLYQANSSIVVTDSHLLITDWRGSTRAVPRTDIARLVRIGVRPFEGPPRPAVIAVDAAGRSLFTMGAAYDEVAVGRTLSVPLGGSFSDVATLREINQKYPGAASGPGLAPKRLFLITIGVALVVGIGAYVAWTALR
jgi:hypothetical protein